MKYLKVTVCIAVISLLSCAPVRDNVKMLPEVTDIDVNTEKVFSADEVTKKPELIGGRQAFLKRIKYPETMKKNRLSGTFIIKYIVTKEGKVTNVEVVRGLSNHENRKLIKLIKEQSYIPGEINGEKVHVYNEMTISLDVM